MTYARCVCQESALPSDEGVDGAEGVSGRTDIGSLVLAAVRDTLSALRTCIWRKETQLLGSGIAAPASRSVCWATPSVPGLAGARLRDTFLNVRMCGVRGFALHLPAFVASKGSAAPERE